MNHVLTTEQAAEARLLISRLAELLKQAEAAPAPSPGRVPVATEKPPLRDVDFADAADALKCDVAAIRAVYEVESRGQGFGPDGRPAKPYKKT
jgi:hypothetical protein